MIYITQFIFIHKNQEAIFHQFEDVAIPLLEKYNGKILYRIRPERDAFIDAEGETPYEVHFIQFESDTDFQKFLKNEERKTFMHLKEASVRSSFLVKGVQL